MPDKMIDRLKKKDAKITARAQKITGKADEKAEKIKKSKLSREKKIKRIAKLNKRTDRKLKRPQRRAAKIEDKIRRFKDAALMVGGKDEKLLKEARGIMLGGRVKNSGMRKKAKSKR